MSLERYPDDKNKVLLKILDFGGEPRISDRIFCRIDGLIETLLSRLTAVPIKVGLSEREECGVGGKAGDNDDKVGEVGVFRKSNYRQLQIRI